jgi:hypothetical protein
MFLKRVRWAALLACCVVVAKACSLFHVRLPMNSFFRPHNLRKFSPDAVAPRIFCSLEQATSLRISKNFGRLHY